MAVFRPITARPLCTVAALAAATVLLSLCRIAAAQTSGGSGEDNESVATIGDQKVTQAELEAYVAPQLMKLRQERQDILEQGLDRYLSSQVLGREAKARGMSAQDLVKQEVLSKVAAVTDADVDSFYEQNKDRIQGTKEQLAGRIKEYLADQRQQEALEAYTSTLKTKYDVAVLMKPLRVDVDSASAPSRGPANAPVTIVEFGDFDNRQDTPPSHHPITKIRS